MAFTDPIVLADSNPISPANQTFTRQFTAQGGSDWIENDAIPSLVRKIVMRHSNAGPSTVKGAKPVRRHLVQFTLDKWNATTAKTEKAVVNCTITVDAASSITVAEIEDLSTFAANFLTDGNVEKLLRDEC
jgi:hypothetical protein